MIYFREEGNPHKNGINYTKTSGGHGIQIKVPLFYCHIIFGYYWGINFNWRYGIYNREGISIFDKEKTK